MLVLVLFSMLITLIAIGIGLKQGQLSTGSHSDH